MEYTVTITEQITETREYQIESDTPENAAQTARNMWVNIGENPEDGINYDITERSFEVMRPDGITEFFDESDLT